MRSIKIAVLLTILGLTACQKVIDLKLKNDSGKYVIEGNVTNLPGPYQVTIGKTDAVNADYTLQGVSQAAVIISDNAGNTETLQEITPGIYQTKTLQGVEGRTYNLDVTVGNAHLTATSVMPHQVNLDSLYIVEVFNFSKTVKAVVPLFTDPVGQGNSYRFNQTINGVLDKTLYYQNDDFTDGKTSTWSMLRPDPDSTLHGKDNVNVEMQCIDAPMYKYWYSVDMSSTGNGSTIASNPVTNIVGGALGYFSAHTSQTKTIVVP
ncbi:DUF4249 domain-containing protein [Puia sp.]|jgi:hypothetical protein|uniref:DUF4249 domain-containing protein n=1 Tax=Puia sp. TaxID=2045100 RepID=UPI002F407E04